MTRTTILTLLTVLLAALLLAPLPAVAQTKTGVIRGLIRQPGRGPLPSVTVVVGPDLSSKSPVAFTAYAITGPDGRFEIPNVPLGSYWICPQVANSEYLNPCNWDARPPTATVTLAPGRLADADVDLTLARGVPFWVQVDDPHQLLGRQGGLRIGARSAAGNTVDARPPIIGPGRQRLYRVIVPLGAPYTPLLDTGKFQVEHGAPGERLVSPFDKITDSKIGEAAKVFRLSVKSVTR